MELRRQLTCGDPRTAEMSNSRYTPLPRQPRRDEGRVRDDGLPAPRASSVAAPIQAPPPSRPGRGKRSAAGSPGRLPNAQRSQPCAADLRNTSWLEDKQIVGLGNNWEQSNQPVPSSWPNLNFNDVSVNPFRSVHPVSPACRSRYQRAVAVNPIPCSGGTSSSALSRRRASTDRSRDPAPDPPRVRRQPRL